MQFSNIKLQKDFSIIDFLYKIVSLALCFLIEHKITSVQKSHFYVFLFFSIHIQVISVYEQYMLKMRDIMSTHLSTILNYN